MKKVLITDDVHPILISGLEEKQYEVHFQPTISFAETLAVIDSYDGLVINSKIFCGQELLSKATKLKWIARLGSGMEVIDTVACDALGIKYFNSPEGNRNAVAEHTLALLLNLMNNISKSNEEVKEGKWIREPNRGEELSGKTVGIIGFGNTGKAFSKVLRGFDVKILACDKYKTNFGNDYVRESNLEEIWEQADVLSMHLPLTLETTHFVNYQFLKRFKKPIYFINTSRGKVVLSKDLLQALSENLLKAVGLDVLENEKLKTFSATEKEEFELLTNQSNIIITPHIAGWTHQSKLKIAQTVLLKLSTTVI
jgi:D-3-phosphoglycerate dehydrogenase